MRIAIVHDYLTQYGGAERVLDEMKILYPDAPVYVSVYDPSAMPAHYRNWDIRCSWLNNLGGLRTKHRHLLPLLAGAFESLDLSDYDVVLASSSGLCHGVITGPHTCKVTYCHSPARFLWDFPGYARRERLSRSVRIAMTPFLSRLRQWDVAASARTDYWIATSDLVRRRIATTYRRESTIIPPPVDTSRFDVGRSHDGYFLLLMRLVGWKRADIVIEACNRLRLPLIVAGDGRSMPQLKAMAGPTVTFFGQANDEQMRALYANCRAFILPSEEDFGITPLEAMASGKPVIAYGAGGVLDTVIPGVTGTFFDEQTADCLTETLQPFDEKDYDPTVIRRHAEEFDSLRFRDRLHAMVLAAMRSHLRSVPLPMPLDVMEREPALAAE